MHVSSILPGIYRIKTERFWGKLVFRKIFLPTFKTLIVWHYEVYTNEATGREYVRTACIVSQTALSRRVHVALSVAQRRGALSYACCTVHLSASDPAPTDLWFIPSWGTPQAYKHTPTYTHSVPAPPPVRLAPSPLHYTQISWAH